MGSFESKIWQDGQSGGTPLNAEALIDLEERLSAYSDTVGVGVIPFSWPGVLTMGEGSGTFVFPFHAQIVSVQAAVTVPPTGADIVVDLDKNGSTMFSVQENRPRIVPGNSISSPSIPALNSVIPGDVINIDVDQVGSSVPGSNLTVTVSYRPMVVQEP